MVSGALPLFLKFGALGARLGRSGLCFLPWMGLDSVNLGGMPSGRLSQVRQ